MLDPLATQSLGGSDARVPRLGFGGGTLGDPIEVISEEQAEETIRRAYELGIRYFDTAPWYGLTKSERRIGKTLQSFPRESYFLNTKVGRVFSRPTDPALVRRDRWKGGLSYDFRFDYSASGFQRSYEDSLGRMGLDRVNSLVIHDLDYKFHLNDFRVERCFKELTEGGGFDWLLERKRCGDIQAIGAGINQVEMFDAFLDRFDGLDYFLVAMPYTLLDQPALEGAFQRCQEKGVSVVVGAVYASGILAQGTKGDGRYGYETASEAIVERVKRIEDVCDRHGIPIGAAALQFPLGHPVVASVIPGGNSPEIVETNFRWMSLEIPQALWDELKAEGLLREDAPTP